MATKLEELAVEVALVAALKRGPTTNAYVPWNLVERIRTELERLGVDWRSFHPKNSERRDV